MSQREENIYVSTCIYTLEDVLKHTENLMLEHANIISRWTELDKIKKIRKRGRRGCTISEIWGSYYIIWWINKAAVICIKIAYFEPSTHSKCGVILQKTHKQKNKQTNAFTTHQVLPRTIPSPPPFSPPLSPPSSYIPWQMILGIISTRYKVPHVLSVLH